MWNINGMALLKTLSDDYLQNVVRHQKKIVHISLLYSEFVGQRLTDTRSTAGHHHKQKINKTPCKTQKVLNQKAKVSYIVIDVISNDISNCDVYF